MALPNKRIEAQGVTRHPWEQEAVVFLRDELPDSDPIRLWSLVNLINREGATILDVRDSKEFGAGHITGAINIPYASFDGRASELEKFKDKPLVVVCKMGQHSGAIGRKLLAQGFEDVRRLSGGMSEWQASNLPMVK